MCSTAVTNHATWCWRGHSTVPNTKVLAYDATADNSTSARQNTHACANSHSPTPTNDSVAIGSITSPSRSPADSRAHDKPPRPFAAFEDFHRLSWSLQDRIVERGLVSQAKCARAFFCAYYSTANGSCPTCMHTRRPLHADAPSAVGWLHACCPLNDRATRVLIKAAVG